MNPDDLQESPQQAIEKYTTDFTKLAADGKLDPVIGRDEEIRRTVQVLSRRTKNNPVLIGNPGVGKTAIVEGLAKRLLEQRGIVLTVTETALASRVKEGYDAQYGARPLKRFLQKHVETLSAKLILADEVSEGDTIFIDTEDDKLVANVK